MRIAQISPLYESVPPSGYGGTERVVSALTETLVALGHEVTLFASGDSVTAARLIAGSDRSLRCDPESQDGIADHVAMLERVVRMADEFDVIHNHTDYLFYPFSRRIATPHVTTLHGRLDIADLVPLYREFADVPVISISDDQRGPLPGANWQATVYHGLPDDRYSLHEAAGEYLAFIGRISPEKGVDRAIAIATAAGVPLRIAAKVDPADMAYYQQQVKPLLKHPQVELIGEIDDTSKNDFLGNAMGVLFPIDWPEPFGLAMVESMACGTPVIAYGRGSVAEVMRDGVSGFIVDDDAEAVTAVGRLAGVSRRRCR